jgi:hypothetical protein
MEPEQALKSTKKVQEKVKKNYRKGVGKRILKLLKNYSKTPAFLIYV